MKKLLIMILLGLVFSTIISAQIRQRQNIAVNVNAGFAFPYGDFSDFYNTGFTGTAGITYKYSELIHFYLAGGGVSFNIDNEGMNKKLSDQGIDATVNLDGSLTNIPLSIGAKLNYEYISFRFYTGLAFVINILTLESSGTLTDSDGPTTIPYSKESFSKTSLSLTLGFAIPVSRKLEFDINGSFNAISDIDNNIIPKIGPVSDPVRAGTVRYISLMGSLNYYF